MSDLPKIKISLDEVRDPRLDAGLALQSAGRRATAAASAAAANREAPPVPFYYNPIVVYAFFGALAAVLVWAALEPSMRASELSDDDNAAGFLLFPLMGAAIGLFIACSDALLSRNLFKAVHCGAVGAAIGGLAGVVGIFVGGIIFMLCISVAASLGQGAMSGRTFNPTGLAFFLIIVGRAMAWTIVASGMGVGQGVALKSKKLVLNGLAGGLIGGFIGGLAFDPIDKLLNGGRFGEVASVSRFFGMTTIGLAVGLFTGLVESMAKDAWLHMKAGPLAGKQFVIYRDPTVLGSSPKSDIYLFKDPAIEPSHAEVRAVGTRYELRDLGSKHGVHVNGKRITARVLEPGDEIRMGETVLQYAEKARK